MLCKDLDEGGDEIVKITSVDECQKLATMFGKRWDGSKHINTWTAYCHYWNDPLKKGQNIVFNRYTGNYRGTYAQQACKKEVIDTKSP